MHKRSASPYLFILVFLSYGSKLHAQDSLTLVSDSIINAYASVWSAARCSNQVLVNNASGFSKGDRVLLIQMKGAVVNTENNDDFGLVTQLNGAGTYEYNRIRAVDGNLILLEQAVLGTYDTQQGVVQLVKVPVYENAIITRPLICPAWNGETGGILAFKVNGRLTLRANIRVSGKGFAGGKKSYNPNGYCTEDYTDYAYTLSSGKGAEKGEGIAIADKSRNAGRGAWSNGGGGGNKHNSGGGGGSHVTAGGRGGNQTDFCATALPVGGEGARPLRYANDRIWMGGGGGCSDNNDRVGTVGGNGGGIILIEAERLSGNRHIIAANGADVPFIKNDIGDGAGGGGAGGAIFLQCKQFDGPLELQVNGGKGGDQYTSFAASFGPGGGGGIGAVLLSAPALPAGYKISAQPGAAGQLLNAGFTDNRRYYGAKAGVNGNALLLNRKLAAIANAPCTDTLRPTVSVDTVKKPEPDNRLFRILRSRKNIIQQRLTVTGDSIYVRLFDNGTIDGDIVSIFLNGVLLHKHIRLDAIPFTFSIAVKDLPATSELVMLAENLGSIPPNTARMEARAGGKTYEIDLRSNEGESGTIQLIREL